MRQIKFRVWDKELKTLGSVDHLYIPSEGIQSNFLMQYTGLVDKNGKEIYEGDIVKGDAGICIIEWNEVDTDRSWELAVGFRISFGMTSQSSKCEVIGNIYENPELLT